MNSLACCIWPWWAAKILRPGLRWFLREGTKFLQSQWHTQTQKRNKSKNVNYKNRILRKHSHLKYYSIIANVACSKTCLGTFDSIRKTTKKSGKQHAGNLDYLINFKFIFIIAIWIYHFKPKYRNIKKKKKKLKINRENNWP